jgi:hypothetical protein
VSGNARLQKGFVVLNEIPKKGQITNWLFSPSQKYKWSFNRIMPRNELILFVRKI